MSLPEKSKTHIVIGKIAKCVWAVFVITYSAYVVWAMTKHSSPIVERVMLVYMTIGLIVMITAAIFQYLHVRRCRAYLLKKELETYGLTETERR